MLFVVDLSETADRGLWKKEPCLLAWGMPSNDLSDILHRSAGIWPHLDMSQLHGESFLQVESSRVFSPAGGDTGLPVITYRGT